MTTGRDDRDPAGELDVRPVRLSDPGGGRRSALAALVVITVIVGGGILAARLLEDGPARPGATGAAVASPVAGTAAPATPSPLPAASARGPLELPAVEQSSSSLAAAVRDRELDGTIVLVRGNLEVIPLPCDRAPTAFHTCVLLAIENLDIPVIAGAIALPWRDVPPVGSYLVVTPRNRSLV